MKNKCPHPKCGKEKPREMYACRTHWFSLPKTIRDAIWDGYRSNASAWIQADKAAMNYWHTEVAKENV